jgi:hypothetical protein
LVISCSIEDEKYYNETNINDWQEFADELQINTDFNNTLFLISYPTYCGDCLSELNEWNKSVNTIEAEIYLVVVDRYRENSINFTKNNNFYFKSYHDSIGVGLKNGLIPYIPHKVYFKNKRLLVRDRIGDKKSYDLIFSKID